MGFGGRRFNSTRPDCRAAPTQRRGPRSFQLCRNPIMTAVAVRSRDLDPTARTRLATHRGAGVTDDVVIRVESQSVREPLGSMQESAERLDDLFARTDKHSRRSRRRRWRRPSTRRCPPSGRGIDYGDRLQHQRLHPRGQPAGRGGARPVPILPAGLRAEVERVALPRVAAISRSTEDERREFLEHVRGGTHGRAVRLRRDDDPIARLAVADSLCPSTITPPNPRCCATWQMLVLSDAEVPAEFGAMGPPAG